MYVYMYVCMYVYIYIYIYYNTIYIDTWAEGLPGRQVSGWRPVPAEGLQGKG